MTKVLLYALTALAAFGSAQLAIRQEGEQQVPGMPGAGDIARCTANGDCPVSLSTSTCLGKIDPQCAEELCGVSVFCASLRLRLAPMSPTFLDLTPTHAVFRPPHPPHRGAIPSHSWLP
ncbi:hypothetical protein A1Q2_00402 [Trichosporon asahii var. asahii CBS 8904]|uniref:Uncharacterized protein n=1 Tax=Trichosporon asahii var. asahii (strain CBS 8904) TaxID=1220162 RepID=K1W0G6_TRIAC|nr:hypothetical protein A1Q2_00402 [Trichosporon asahii var. asahii CBS 8904]